MVLVTREMDSAREVADQVVIMDEGCIAPAWEAAKTARAYGFETGFAFPFAIFPPLRVRSCREVFDGRSFAE
jgi:energy-coupling factor transporter ATP-binding protein EcfA2